jgi:hypothetical protein
VGILSKQESAALVLTWSVSAGASKQLKYWIQGLFGLGQRPPRQIRASQNFGERFACLHFAHVAYMNLN